MDSVSIWLISGAAFGFVALVLDKGKQQSGMLRIVIGAIGGILGGMLLTTLQVVELAGIEGEVVRSGAGAAALLLLARMFN